MIGNDIVDLQLAKIQSNWQRPNYLEKIFSKEEIQFILNAENSELEVWKLWSRKEAAYKIYNRETGIRGYFPWKLKCSNPEITEDKEIGLVLIEDKVYCTETYVNQDYIYTIASKSVQLFDKIIAVNQHDTIIKMEGMPFLETNLKLVSITHHGRFERKITLLDS